MTHLVSVEITLNESRDDDAGFAGHSTEKGIGEFSGCPGHTQRCAAGAVFRFDDFVATKLNTFDQCGSFFAFKKLAATHHTTRAERAASEGQGEA